MISYLIIVSYDVDCFGEVFLLQGSFRATYKMLDLSYALSNTRKLKNVDKFIEDFAAEESTDIFHNMYIIYSTHELLCNSKLEKKYESSTHIC